MITSTDPEFHHYAADMEAVVTKIGRIAGQQNMLLVDATHALQNDRLAVVEEYIDRVNEMSKEIAALVEGRPR